MMRYSYTHTSTKGTTGYFSCEPSPLPAPGDALPYLAAHPLDDFMRRHLMGRLGAMPVQEAANALCSAFAGGNFPPAIRALLRELVLLNPSWEAAHPVFAAGGRVRESDAETSLIFLRWSRLPDRELHAAWGRVFSANMREHRALKSPQEHGLAPLFSNGFDASLPGHGKAFTSPFPVSLPELHARFAAVRATERNTRGSPPAAETAALAEERLSALSLIAGREMRHTASLSPVALLRPWNLRLRTRCGRHEHSLEGQATTYGRGLSVADARASCLMEMVERASAYLSISDTVVEHRARPAHLRHARFSELREAGHDALNPNDFPVEVPYEDSPLYWVRGRSARGEPVYLPVQMAGLFSNLDEVSLFDAPGSSGIAAGCSVEEAKIATILEIFERDAEATTPFSKASCFILEADADADPGMAALLSDYKARGINVQFQDLTGPSGVPVCKCFVMSSRGVIAAGHGAGLSARRAVIAALTETPFPYPDGGPSGPMLRNLPVKKLHELPDYSLPTPEANLSMLEELLTSSGREPVYMDLTHAGLAFPVIRCCIPGLELTAERDVFSRIPYRLYANYLRLVS